MNKWDIKKILQKYNLNDFYYYFKDENFIYLQKRNNNYEDKNHGLYIHIKFSYKELKDKKSVEFMCKNHITR